MKIFSLPIYYLTSCFFKKKNEKKYGFEQLMTVTVKFVLTFYVDRNFKRKTYNYEQLLYVFLLTYNSC